MRLPIKALSKLWKLEKYLTKYHIITTYTNGGDILIKSTKTPMFVEMDLPFTINIRTVSFESREPDDKESIRYTLEYQMAENNNLAEEQKSEFYNTVSAIKSRLSDDVKRTLEVMTAPPEDYVAKYGDSIKQCSVAKYLNKTPKEIVSDFEVIRLHFVNAGIGPDMSIETNHRHNTNNAGTYTLKNISIDDKTVKGELYRDQSGVGYVYQNGDKYKIVFINKDEADILDRHIAEQHHVPSWLKEAKLKGEQITA